MLAMMIKFGSVTRVTITIMAFIITPPTPNVGDADLRALEALLHGSEESLLLCVGAGALALVLLDLRLGVRDHQLQLHTHIHNERLSHKQSVSSFS
jgi:hypothetical protein